MEPLLHDTLAALDLHRPRTVADVVRATGLADDDVREALAELVSSDLARVLALSPRAYLLKPAGAQRLQLLAPTTKGST